MGMHGMHMKVRGGTTVHLCCYIYPSSYAFSSCAWIYRVCHNSVQETKSARPSRLLKQKHKRPYHHHHPSS